MLNELVSNDVLTLLFAALSVLFAILAWRISRITLTYMRGRDLELDTRSGWIEIHKAMLNLRVHRDYVMLPSKMAQRGIMLPTQQDSLRCYALGVVQLRGQLDRLNDDPLIVKLAEFLDVNQLAAQWQSDDYQRDFDAFVHDVAMKSRPK